MMAVVMVLELDVEALSWSQELPSTEYQDPE